MRSGLAVLLTVAACGFDGAASTPGATVDGALAGDGPRPPADAAVPINLVASANGGTLLSFSSEFCTGDVPGECAGGERWRASNIHDGLLGKSADGRDIYMVGVWCSADRNDGAPAERFELGFQRSALVERVSIQNFGEGAYWTTIFEGWLRRDGNWERVIDETTLDATEELQTFVLGTPIIADAFALVLTDGSDSNYFELGEVEVWGTPR